jgi:hypothetical protein
MPTKRKKKAQEATVGTASGPVLVTRRGVLVLTESENFAVLRD